jgi:hypothetical protein
VCPASVKAQRKCENPGFVHSKTARFKVDDHSKKYMFCPGKATWYERTVLTYQQCVFALETGILPKDGHFEVQEEFFNDAYPAFVHHYNERKYGRVWQDVNEFTTHVFKAISGMLGGKKG